MKHEPQVESYVPVSAFYEGKEELSGRSFSDRFAVLDAERDFCVLVSRGECPENTVVFRGEDRAFLRRALNRDSCVFAETERGGVLLFGTAMTGGLIPAWFPEGNTAVLAQAAQVVGASVVFSPSLQEAMGVSRGRPHDFGEICRRFAAEFAVCKRLFGNGEPADFRLRCAEIAAFSGCRTDVKDLPVGAFPLTDADRRTWTVFLCCLFLSLRGADANGPTFRMCELGRQTLVTGMEYRSNRDSAKHDAERFAFLGHPAFREIGLERAENGYRISVALTRKAGDDALRAVSRVTWFLFGLEFVAGTDFRASVPQP